MFDTPNEVSTEAGHEVSTTSGMRLQISAFARVEDGLAWIGKVFLSSLHSTVHLKESGGIGDGYDAPRSLMHSLCNIKGEIEKLCKFHEMCVQAHNGN
jgi:hypothetical protein